MSRISRQGKRDYRDHAADGQGLADALIDHEGQGDVDKQAQIADAHAGKVLDHGADTVQAGGGKLIGEHENLIVKGTHHGHAHNDQIRPKLFHIVFDLLFVQEVLQFLKRNIAYLAGRVKGAETKIPPGDSGGFLAKRPRKILNNP